MYVIAFTYSLMDMWMKLHHCGKFSPPASAVGKNTMMTIDMLLLV